MAVQSPTFGLMLKRHRLAGGMTQEELADRTGVSVRAIGDLERGLRQPRNDTLQILLETLQLAPDETARLEVAARAGSTGYHTGYPLGVVPGAFGTGTAELLLQTGSFLGALPPSPLIGRQQGVDRIVMAADAVIGGGARLVLLTGEPGIGKTRLAQQIALEAAKRGFLVVSGRCYEPEQDVPFYPFLEALATAYQWVPRAIRDDIPHRWPYLGALLPEDVLQAAGPAHGTWSTGLDEQQRLFRAVGGFLKVVSEDVPVAMLLDDLHWADDASLKLVLHLARHSRSERLLLLGTYRDVEIGPHHPLKRALVDLNRERLLERVILHRLGRASTAELIVAITGATDVCPDLLTMIDDGTDGNPFFIHALAQQALYADLSTQQRQRLHLAAGEALHQLPDRVRARRAAELARHFREGGDRERAAAYSMRSGEQAVGLYAYGEAERHFRMAVELLMPEEPAPDDVSLVSEALAKLGRVLHVTERYEEALTTLEQAAELYRTQDNLEREGHVVAEIGWIHRNRGALAALYAALARLFFGLGRYSDELAAAERAAQLARDSGDDVVLAVAEARRGAALMTFGRRQEARAALEAAIALSEATGDLATATAALDYLGEIARDGGDYRQGQRDCERAVELAEQIGVPGRIAWTLTKLGRIHLLKGEWARARAIFERALCLLGDDPRSAAYLRIHLGQLDLLEGNWEKGSAQVEAAMSAEAPGRDLWLRWHGQRLLAERDLLDGQPAAALARFTPLVGHTGGREPHPYREAQGRAEAGRLGARTGRGTQARDQLRQALAIAQRLGAHPSIRHFRQLIAELGRAEESRSFKPSIGHQRETFHIEARTDTA